MTGDEKTRLRRQILSYLLHHPDAQDTVDGIRQWWLLDELIRTSLQEVEAALSCLVEEGWLMRVRRIDSTECYKVNERKREEIASFALHDSPR